MSEPKTFNLECIHETCCSQLKHGEHPCREGPHNPDKQYILEKINSTALTMNSTKYNKEIWKYDHQKWLKTAFGSNWKEMEAKNCTYEGEIFMMNN